MGAGLFDSCDYQPGEDSGLIKPLFSGGNQHESVMWNLRYTRIPAIMINDDGNDVDELIHRAVPVSCAQGQYRGDKIQRTRR